MLQTTREADKEDAAPNLTLEPRYGDLVSRIGLFTTGALLLLLAWQNQGDRTVEIVVTSLMYLTGFTLLGLGAVRNMPMQRLGAVAPIILIVALSLNYYAVLSRDDVYSVDLTAFTHESAELVLEGKNPYAVKDKQFLVTTAEKFGHSPFIITRLTDGSIIDRLMVYPGGHVLIYIPFLALGGHDIRWLTAIASIAILIVCCWQAPPQLRPIAIVPIVAEGIGILPYVAFGFLDQVWVLPLLLAAICMNTGKFDKAALLFGLAASIKQTPWALAPFLLVWVWKESQHLERAEKLRKTVRFAALATAVFVAVNLPFMAWGFLDWLSAITYHFHTSIEVTGAGLSRLTKAGFLDVGSGFYTALSFGALLVMLGAYMRWYDKLKESVWIAPGIVFWFAYRSFQHYFVYWTPLLLVSILIAYGRQAEPAPTRDAKP